MVVFTFALLLHVALKSGGKVTVLAEGTTLGTAFATAFGYFCAGVLVSLFCCCCSWRCDY